MALYNVGRLSEAFLVISFALLKMPKAMETDRATLTPVMLHGESSSTCPSHETKQAAFDGLQQNIRMTMMSISQAVAIRNHCGPGQWHRAAFINMTDPQQQCPSEWIKNTTSGIRACSRLAIGCVGSIFATGRQYSKVCGRITAYQLSTTDAFHGYHGSAIDDTLDGAYVDGVSVTYGSRRNHIWTFAAGLSELNGVSNVDNCPCSDSPGAALPPSFVGNHYFCESANTDEEEVLQTNRLYTEDKLWDGKQCDNEGTCCTNSSPPWFSVELPDTTADDIEVRICCDEGLDNENVLIELLEFYVQ